MKSIRIFGIGSSFGADQIGLLVINQIKNKIPHHFIQAIVSIDYFDRPGLHLIELMQDAAEVHLIDAMETKNGTEGFIHRYTDINMFNCSNKIFSSHGYGVAEVLQLAKTMNCLPPKLVIHGIEMGEAKAMTEQIIKACDKLANNIIDELMVSQHSG